MPALVGCRLWSLSKSCAVQRLPLDSSCEDRHECMQGAWWGRDVCSFGDCSAVLCKQHPWLGVSDLWLHQYEPEGQMRLLKASWAEAAPCTPASGAALSSHRPGLDEGSMGATGTQLPITPESHPDRHQAPFPPCLAASGINFSILQPGSLLLWTRRPLQAATSLLCLQQQPVLGLQTSANNFSVLQPGSSVATALSEGEAKRKHCFVLEVNRDNWRLEKMPLRTVRPFQFDSVRDAACLPTTLQHSRPIGNSCTYVSSLGLGPSVGLLQMALVRTDWLHLLSCTPRFLHTTKRLQRHMWP